MENGSHFVSASLCYHIEARTRWLTFSRRYFQMNFLQRKLLYFDSNFIEICSQGPSWQKPSTDSDNGLVMNKRQAIIWTNDSLVWWRIYASHGRNGLKNAYELWNLSAITFSTLHEYHILQCMGKIFRVEFQKYLLKFHTEYLTHILKDA